MISRLDAKSAIKKIVEDDGNIIKTGITLPIRRGQKFNVYRIPLDLLVPNVLNDRISWKIREYESEHDKKLSIDNDVDVDFLYSTIYAEHPNENKKTLKDLAMNGQQVDGVITNDGIIIDGNRRATLLRELFNGAAAKFNKSVEDFRYFNAIVLPEDCDPKEIMALETMIQIAADQQVSYNRICLYIKVDNLLNAGYNYTQIKDYMGLKNEKEVENKHEVYNLMVKYLEHIGKPNHYTLLDGLEDQFLNTIKVFKKMEQGDYEAQWDYTQEDVADFKMVCFDYMRAKFEGKKYRSILVGKPSKTDGVFIEKHVWDNFLEHHNNIIDKNDPETEEDWKMLGKRSGSFERNLNDARNHLNSALNDKNVSKLILEVNGKVDRIAELLEEMSELNVDDIAELKGISSKIYEILKRVK